MIRHLTGRPAASISASGLYAEFDGETIDLSLHPFAAPHTLHGPSHTQPWQPVLHETSRFVMSLRYLGDDQWPWSFKASQQYALEGDRLRLSLTDIDRRRMPAGLGWHPYFASEDKVSAKEEFVWPHRPDYLPVGFREEVVDDAEIDSRDTRCVQEWKSAVIRCTPKLAATVSAEAPFDFLVVHRGSAKHICVEPVSHVQNAWNLEADQGRTGARLLESGTTLLGRMTIDIDRLGRRALGAL